MKTFVVIKAGAGCVDQITLAVVTIEQTFPSPQMGIFRYTVGKLKCPIKFQIKTKVLLKIFVFWCLCCGLVNTICISEYKLTIMSSRRTRCWRQSRRWRRCGYLIHFGKHLFCTNTITGIESVQVRTYFIHIIFANA